MLKRGHAFDDGETVSFGGRYPVMVFDASEEVKDRYTIQATNLLGRPYRVMQVIVCDRQGCWPWQAECERPFREVKVHRAATH